MATREGQELVSGLSEAGDDQPRIWEKTEITCIEFNRMIREWPQQVFSFFESSQRIIRWLSPRATLDFRVGGVYVFSWGQFGEVTGEFVEIVPAGRLAFTWGDRLSNQTFVTIDIKGFGTKTHLRLQHQLFGGVTKTEWNEGHINEWTFFLDNLCSVIEHGTDLRPEKAKENGWHWILGRFVRPDPGK